MSAAHPTAEARDFRKITRLHSLKITDHESASFVDGPTVAEAVREVTRLRHNARVRVWTENFGALISGSPDEVLPILNALLTHADETDHLEGRQ